MKPPHRLSLAIEDLEYALTNFAAFHRNLGDLMADGYPRTASGGEKAPGGAQTVVTDPTTGQTVSVPLTATEAAVVARQRYDRVWQEMDASAIELQALARRIAKLVANYASTTPAAKPDPCNGMGKPGYPDWGDPNCKASADKDGLCHRCYQRSWRWRQSA